jgi:hypothetical protein
MASTQQNPVRTKDLHSVAPNFFEGPSDFSPVLVYSLSTTSKASNRNGSAAQPQVPRNFSELAISNRSPISAIAMPWSATCGRFPSGSRTSPVWPQPRWLPSCLCCSRSSLLKSSSCASSRSCFDDAQSQSSAAICDRLAWSHANVLHFGIRCPAH